MADQKHYHVDFKIIGGVIPGEYRANPKYSNVTRRAPNGTFAVSLMAESEEAAAQDVITDYQEQYPGAVVRILQVFEHPIF